MKKMQLMTALSIGVLSINLAFATPKQAVEQVRENAGQVLNILKQANGRNDAAVRKQAEDYATPYFDFALMTRLAVGAPWNRASEAQKQTLVQEFRQMLIRVYASQMLRYKNAQVQVKDNAVAKDGGSLLRGKQIVEVRATIKPTSGQPVEAVFSTYKDGNIYRVFNVSFEGVFKLVESQRQQFKPILDAKGVDGLIAELKSKNGSR